MNEPKSKKKRFFNSPNSALDGVGQAFAMAEDGMALNVEHIPIERISPDPQNPRRTGLDPLDPTVIDPNDPEMPAKARMVEGLQDLATSIREAGVIQPIRVYRYGPGFRIATGERRYLASIMAGKSSIPAIIDDHRPSNLRYQQLIENLQREDLDLRSRIENLNAVCAERKANGDPIESHESLAAVVGLARTHAFNLWTVMQAPPDVFDLIPSGSNVAIATMAKICRIKEPLERAEALNEMFSNGEPQKEKPKAGPGRPPKYKFPPFTRPDTAKRIFEALTGDSGESVDWTNHQSVNRALLKAVKALEKKS